MFAISLRSRSAALCSRLAQPSAMSTAVSVQRRFYSENVHEHFRNPRNVGSFAKSEPSVGTAVVGKAACGDVIKMQIKVDDNGIIQDAKFKTFGCGSAIASSSYATELIKGKGVDQALALKNTDIADYLKLPPVKIHCSLLAEDAIKHAIEDWKTKRVGDGEVVAGVSP
uniref:Iron-sulfur cluster assembly protein n=1 Tax=Chromera velia CCMP2878 TaxID=1169474 RepID=A0A0G4HUI6_9ALVE|mmetsp:Transcript_50856/g.99995  ORF Transcript_50856/g.99995 Transcript_50856/m.99995 type:complete len:169 (-) Transcript_50856:33-539(-)|eukprot:Cvel_31875.t1-p1 / transcript=Cvel_31875.t1 / gene=Cvel_31875 / organism=Chromera_velia_CCMP2878 / gene_product=NifU-like protein, putative / transcript_product=NifU-like protein, putative / location=Cvel_scaffold4834:5103-7208(+) / protein_length=168 / sequence_SO=supercontig / SO=protein_coding / is_pseudo=false